VQIINLGLGIQGVSWTPKIDDRGVLIRILDSEFLKDFGNLNQITYVSNKNKGTLRGLHFQIPPNAESKVISCLRGRLFDVMVQIEPESEYFGQVVCVEISATKGINSLIIPKGFAHGYLTLDQDTELLYAMDSPFNEESVRGIHWRSNHLNIPWPIKVSAISERDQKNPSWDEYFS
jgi:dTDP-4-dehydrorhamnose 3,5-epimerase